MPAAVAESLMNKGLIFLGVLFFASSPAFGKTARVWKKGDPFPVEILKLYEVVVHSSVTVEAGNYIYSYTIFNSTKNPLPLYRFQVDLRHDPGAHPLPYQDLTPGHSLTDHNDMIINALRVHPVDQVHPKGWEFERAYGLSPRRNGTWSTEEPSPAGRVIKQGHSMSGFQLVAKEPPGIREWVVSADTFWAYDWRYGNLTHDLDFYEKSNELAAELSKGVEYSGKTLVPVVPPIPFSVGAWSARMAPWIGEARELGWIKSDEQLARARDLLSGIKTASDTDLDLAIQSLVDFSREGLKEGALTKEADALLRLNALYLLKHMKPDGK